MQGAVSDQSWGMREDWSSRQYYFLIPRERGLCRVRAFLARQRCCTGCTLSIVSLKEIYKYMLGTRRQILPRDRTNTGGGVGGGRQSTTVITDKGVGREELSIESAQTFSSTVHERGAGGSGGGG